jgi:hypothetical protein
MSAAQAIAEAERVLALPSIRDGEVDQRWQALLEVAEYVASDPETVWPFVRRWGAAEDDDIRAAVATCLLEHLLEHHFDRIFPLVEEAVRAPLFADTFSLCWKYGQSELPDNAARFDALRAVLATSRRRGERPDPAQSA